MSCARDAYAVARIFARSRLHASALYRIPPVLGAESGVKNELVAGSV